MKSHYYGQNFTDTKAVLEKLSPFILAHPQLHWAVLLDSAFDYESDANTVNLGPHLNCYSRLNDLDNLAPVAPCLYAIDASAAGLKACETLLVHASGRPMLSVVASLAPLADLVKTWAPLHWVYALDPQDKQRFVLRMADTRTLPQLPQLLSPADWQALRGPLELWFVVDRTGKLVALPAAPEGTQASKRIAVDAKTLGKMVDQAMPDTLLQHMVERAYEDINPQQPRLEVFKLMRNANALAVEYNINQMDDLGALAYCTLLTQGAALEHVEVLALLRDKAYAPGSLNDALAALGVVKP